MDIITATSALVLRAEKSNSCSLRRLDLIARETRIKSL